MGEMVRVGNRETAVDAYLAEPSGAVKGAVIVVHEVWGLVEHTKDVAERFAAAGYVALAPSLLAGSGMTPEVAADLQEKLSDPEQRSAAQPKLREMMAPLHSPEFGARTTAALRGCFEHLYDLPPVRGRVAVVGFCLGGTYSFSLAVHEPRLRAAVPFYGHADFSVEELSRINCPVLAFYGQEDEGLVSKLPELEQKMDKAGVQFAAVVYPGTGHAFFNDTNKMRYSKEASADAWTRTLDFLVRSFRA